MKLKKEFSAKGIKQADEVLKRANMTDEERRSHQRWTEVLSDRASVAMTIEFEAKLKAKKKAKKLAKKNGEKTG